MQPSHDLEAQQPQAVAPQKETQGELCWKAFKAGSFLSYGRWCGWLSIFFCYLAFCLSVISDAAGLAIYVLCVGAFVNFVEMPFLCKCSKAQKKILKVVEVLNDKYYMKIILYGGLDALGWFFLTISDHTVLQGVALFFLIPTTLFFIIATIKREKYIKVEVPAEGAGQPAVPQIDPNHPVTQQAVGAATQWAMANPEQAASIASTGYSAYSSYGGGATGAYNPPAAI